MFIKYPCEDINEVQNDFLPDDYRHMSFKIKCQKCDKSFTFIEICRYQGDNKK